MIAIWGNKEHLTCVFPLWFSHENPKSLKNVPKPSKIPSLLSAHAGSYIYCIKNTNIDALRLNAVTPGAQAERNIYIYIYIYVCVPLLHETMFFFFDNCVPLLHETILFCKNTEIRTRGYVNNSRNLPTSRTQRTQGRNIPFEGTPHSDFTGPLKASRASAWSGSPSHRPTSRGMVEAPPAQPASQSAQPTSRAQHSPARQPQPQPRPQTDNKSSQVMHHGPTRDAQGESLSHSPTRKGGHPSHRATLRLANDHQAPRVARRMR